MNAADRTELDSTPYLVSTKWLAEHLEDSNVRIVDCRYYFDGRVGRDEYDNGHLPGAVYLDWSTELSTSDDPIAFKVARGPQVKRVMHGLGIGDDTLIVGYDDEGGHFVSRLWLVMKRHGNDNVRILEGGIVKWSREGRPLTTNPPEARAATFTPRDGPAEILATADEILAARDDPDVAVVDVRRLTEYSGEELRAVRGGRIPGSTWVFWQDSLDWDGDRSFRAADEMRSLYEQAGVTPEKQVITYCQGGVRAAHSAIALKMLGYPNVRVYDGSWEEWANREDLPVETG